MSDHRPLSPLPPPAPPGLQPPGPVPPAVPVAVEAPRRRRRHWARAAGVVAVVAIAGAGALALLATDGGSAGGYSLAAATEHAGEVSSFEMEGEIEAGGISTSLFVAFDRDRRLTSMEIGVPPLGDLSLVIDQAEQVAYLDASAFAGMLGPLPEGARWIRFDASTMAEQLGIDPEDVFTGSGLTGAADPTVVLEAFDDARVDDLGLESLAELDDLEVRHYRVTVDTEDLVDRVGGEAIAGLDELTDLPDDIVYDVWVDGSDRVRQLSNELSSAMGDVATVFRFVTFDEPIDIEIPSADEVVDVAEAFSPGG